MQIYVDNLNLYETNGIFSFIATKQHTYGENGVGFGKIKKLQKTILNNLYVSNISIDYQAKLKINWNRKFRIYL